MKIGIKIKLAVILSAALFLTTITIGVIMVAHQRSSLEAQMHSLAGTITDEFASDVKIPLMQKDGLTMNLIVQNIIRYPGIVDAYILNDNFLIEGHKDIAEVGTEYSGDKAFISKAKENPPWIKKEPGGVVTFAAPVVFKGTTVGYAVISFSDEFISERVHLAVKSLAIIAVIAVVFISLISIPLASGLLRPVFRLFKGTQEIALGNFDYRIPEKSVDEIGDLVNSFNRMASELKKKEILKGAFSRYVSRHVADEILMEPERIRLGGDKRKITIFFADIRGFTALSRGMKPEETVELLNRYFTLITEIIFSFEGTIDKFIGDAVMSVFGSPIRSDRHLEHGVKAAVAIKKAVEAVNELRQGKGLIPLQLGIGLDCGEVIVGNMGSQMRMEFTAVGDAVNLASRLTDLAMGGDIIVSEHTYNSIADNVLVERMPGIIIRGIDQPLTLYKIKDLKGPWKEEVEGVLLKAIAGLEIEAIVH